MKKLLLFILVVNGLTFATTAIGVDLLLNVSNDSRNPDGNFDRKRTELNTHLYPSIMIMPADRFELVPRAGFYVTHFSQTNRNLNTGAETTSDGSTYGVGAGCGFYFRLVEESVFRLSLGPDAELGFGWDSGRDDYWSFDTTASMPVNFDFLITGNFFIGMCPRLASVTYTHDEDPGYDHNRIEFNVQSLWQPTFGFNWNF